MVAAKCLVRRWDVSQRLAQAAEDAARQARNEAARAEGRPQELIYRKLYLPEQGMFADIPVDLALGTKAAGELAATPRTATQDSPHMINLQACLAFATGRVRYANWCFLLHHLRKELQCVCADIQLSTGLARHTRRRWSRTPALTSTAAARSGHAEA